MSTPEAAGPNKVCPHCGAMNATTAPKCPRCGKKYKKRTVLKVLVGLSVLGLVAIVGCAALIGGAANEVSKQLDAEQAKHAITKKRFDSIPLGITQTEVIHIANKQPENKQEFESESFLKDEPDSSSCIYYNKKHGSFGDVFQFCFTNDKLDSKNAY